MSVITKTILGVGVFIRQFQATYDAFQSFLKGASSSKFGIVDTLHRIKSQINRKFMTVTEETLNIISQNLNLYSRTDIYAMNTEIFISMNGFLFV